MALKGRRSPYGALDGAFLRRGWRLDRKCGWLFWQRWQGCALMDEFVFVLLGDNVRD